METVILFIITNVVAQALKGIVAPKYGTTGVQITVVALAVVGAIVWYVALANESVMGAIMEGAKVAAYAIAFYEVIIKRTGVFATTRELK